MRVFTAQEMRKVAKSLLSSEVNLDFDKRDIAAMLRQAADAMEREWDVLNGKDKRPDIDSDTKKAPVGLGIHITREYIKRKRCPDDAVFSNVLVGEWEDVK